MTASMPCWPWPSHGHLRPSHRATMTAVSKPIAAALLDQAESVRLLGRLQAADAPEHPENRAAGAGAPDGRTVGVAGLPAYAYSEDAARYRAWRERQQGRIPELSGLRAADAQAARRVLGRLPGRWMAARRHGS
jgi:hypothetical protein